MTCVPYINNCTPNASKCWRSRYLVVSDDMMMPSPSPMRAISSNSNGSDKIQRLGDISEPANTKHTKKPRNTNSCIPKKMTLEMTIDTGILNRGKYTFPNKPAFVVKVLDVFVKHAAKYVHTVLPA